MGRVFLVELQSRSFYKCRFCHTHLAPSDNILSWSFNCRRGRAYLFSDVVNITLGHQEDKMMLSGLHTVEDIFCVCCGQILGWKYVAAHDRNQKYKEGKFVLESTAILIHFSNRWRIAEATEELNLDACAGSSDADTP
ncbi:hypothetical protein Patl1_10658 [Pistacia atlantica]|uniref:Uncharacterized protein n=1 Tax=Pistacia atlantica TaxID=434234 RepID=A0ACC1A4F2_9ROSI|nr:hypothetical protein Patl1_10658 [Pistacia atlantica]